MARATLVGALVLTALPAEAAQRRITRFDGIRDCERAGMLQFMKQNPNFRRFAIDRSQVEVDQYAGRVGNQFISSVYHGRATYESAAGARVTRFVCLHGGIGRRAVFVYTLPD